MMKSEGRALSGARFLFPLTLALFALLWLMTRPCIAVYAENMPIASSLADMGTEFSTRFIHSVQKTPVEESKADMLAAKYPFYTKTKIPAGTYAGFDQDVPAVSVMAMLVTTDKMDDAMGGEVAKALFSNLDRLQAAHSVGKLIKKERAMNGMSVKMNGGAEKFFKQ